MQFTAVPWMTRPPASRDGRDRRLGRDRPGAAAGRGPLRGSATWCRGKTDGSLLDLFSSPEQKQVIEKITGVMSLLEGHADVVMDGVGPEVIPSVAEIRAKFTKRRQGVGALDRLLRRLLGLDQKMAQYRDGAVFVRRGRQGRHGGLQRRLGRAREPPRARTRSSTRPPWIAARPRLSAVALDPARRRGPARRTSHARRPRARRDRPRRVLGRRRLAGTARGEVFEGHKAGPRVVGRHGRPRAAGGLGRPHRRGGRADGGARRRRVRGRDR